MNHVNHIFRGDVVKFFPESGWLSESNIVKEGVKNMLGDVKNERKNR